MTSLGQAAQLEIPEGVLLGHAFVARLADRLGIRVFFLKGPASVLQGLRKPRTSADVDVFVEPNQLENMLQGLRDKGWRERAVDTDSASYPKHSVTVDHPQWPCCIDVHVRFPGMEYAPSHCFDEMWARSEFLELAGYHVRVPSKVMHILILALHALRSPHQAICRDELTFLASLTTRESLAVEVLDVATVTGSLAAVRPLLAQMLPASIRPEWPAPSKEWRNRLMAREPGSARLIAIIQAPWCEKLKMLWRALFPPPQAFLSTNIYADMSFRGRLTNNLKRWTRFLRLLPRVLNDLTSSSRAEVLSASEKRSWGA